MKKVLCPFFALIVLSGCTGGHDDLKTFVAEVKATKVPVTAKVPIIKPFIHQPYIAKNERNPFSSPKPEMLNVLTSEVPKDCPQVVNDRQKQPLEKFSLDNLTMKGTLGIDHKLWALIQSADGDLHKIKEGYYLGLHNGKVVSVLVDHVEILETVPDGRGCWKERTTQLMLAEAG